MFDVVMLIVATVLLAVIGLFYLCFVIGSFQNFGIRSSDLADRWPPPKHVRTNAKNE